MAPAASLPIEVVGLILDHIYSTSVMSLNQWEEFLRLLALNRYWRAIYQPKLYPCAIVECRFDFDCMTALSNLFFIFGNNFQDNVKSVVFYALEVIETDCNSNIIYCSIAYFLLKWLDIAVYAPMVPNITTVISSQITRIIEPLLLRLPNLLQIFLQTDNRRSNADDPQSILLGYSTVDSESIDSVLVNKRVRYINQVKFQRISLFSTFTDKFSVYGLQLTTDMQVIRFSAEFLEIMSKRPINYTVLAESILREYFIGDDYTGSRWPGYERSSADRHFVCHPGIKFTGSHGQNLIFDIYRFVCAEQNKIISTQSLWS